jgi:hypothetical protein
MLDRDIINRMIAPLTIITAINEDNLANGFMVDTFDTDNLEAISDYIEQRAIENGEVPIVILGHEGGFYALDPERFAKHGSFISAAPKSRLATMVFVEKIK